MNVEHDPDGPNPPEEIEREALVGKVKASERAIVGDAGALQRQLDHAENVLQLETELRRAKQRVKPSFAKLGLDYQLARHSVWIRQTVYRHRKEHPEVMDLGPSLVLLVHEAERRFAREGRLMELPQVIADLAAGQPRSAIRARYLPPRKGPSDQRVLQFLRNGRMEQARRTFEACSEEERACLRVLAVGLATICGVLPMRTTAASIEEAIVGVVDAQPPPCEPSFQTAEVTQ